MRALLLAAKVSVLAGIVVAITGVARVVGEGIETGSWNTGWLVGWILLGALPFVGGTLTGQAVRGPDDQGLKSVAVVTTLLGVLVVSVWFLDGMSRQ